MSSETANSSIARSAARLRWIVICAIGVMALLYLAARFGVELGNARFEHAREDLGPQVRLVGDLSMLLLIMALIRLIQMLGRIAAGELFSAGVVGAFRSFALWLMLMAVVGLVGPPLLQLLGAGAGGPHRVEMRIDFRAVLTLGVTLVLFLLARLLERARTIDEENREFV